jgi:murein L,D-transpeptidase YafK
MYKYRVDNEMTMLLLKKCLLSFSLLWLSYLVEAADAVGASTDALQPAALITVAPRYRYALIAELDPGRLHVYERQADGGFALLRTMAVSIGKEGYGKQQEGDNKTPVGVYRIVSHLTNEQLDDFYGNAAYPVNYPNSWDQLQGRTGHGIWLHAEPIGFTEKTRPLLDSNGCVVLSNNDIDILRQYLDVGYTYVVFTPKMAMISAATAAGIQQQIVQRLREWELAWESLQPEPYLNFYSTTFNNLEKDWAAWVAYKKHVNGHKKFIDVGFSDLGVYAYPGEKDLLLVEFYQSYRSSNFLSKGWKRQLWKLEDDNEWRIVYEGGG